MIVSDSKNSQKRIMKNTIMLYIRMVVIMLVTLYISRIVLNVLGESDFGIYNVVGSVVVSLVFIQNSLISSTQRFLSYELGKGNDKSVCNIFSTSLNIHLVLILIIVFFLETIGAYFLNNILNIPNERLFAANVAYQLSIATFCLNLLRVPYNALVISYEKMDIYAIISIVEAFLKLSIAFFLLVANNDKLIVYAVLVFIVTLLVNSIYIVYCKSKYPQSARYCLKCDKEILKKMLSFSSWNLLGGVTGVAVNEGPGYFMNIYLGVGVNAAMGIAKQVSSAVYQFTANFQTAFNPQLVKVYASKDFQNLSNLIYRTSELSFFLIFLFGFPFILCADDILDIWLSVVPAYSCGFCRLIIISQMIAALSSPLWMVAHATGNIKKYQIVISVFNLFIIPFSWVILFLQYSPYWILVFNILINIFVFAYRVFFVAKFTELSVKDFFQKVVWKSLFLVLLIIPLPTILFYFYHGIIGMFISILCSVTITCIVFWFGGMDRLTRQYVLSFIKVKFLNRK